MIVEELLVRDRDERLASASELAERLDRFLQGSGSAGDAQTVMIEVPAQKVPTARLIAHVPVLPSSDRVPQAGQGMDNATIAKWVALGCLGLSFFGCIILVAIKQSLDR